MKFLIVGLGNIGAKYESTRHNIGFKALDFVAEQSSAFFTEEKYGEISSFKYKGKNIFLLKPNTFMNLSGSAVRYWLIKLKIDVKHLLVVTDDLNLEVGNLRMKKNGSDGGHNGLNNIQQMLSSNQYPRLRIGVGNNFPKGKQIDYVLGKKNGSDGGHNGLNNIQQMLSSNQYPRLRIGVGNNFPKGKQIDYVLGEWTHEEYLILEKKMDIIKDMVLSFCFAGIENTMNTFNNK